MKNHPTWQLSTHHLIISDLLCILFGFKVSGDAFQCKFNVIYRHWPLTIGAADDIIFGGRKEDFSDHNEALDKFFQITRENNFCLGFDKIQHHFFGDTYINKGHQPTSNKIKAISLVEQSTNVNELQSFVGMCNFLSKYSAWHAEPCDDLQKLTCKGVHFNWGPKHTEAFNSMKKELTLPPVLSYYHPNNPLVLQIDVCTIGLGGVLLLDTKPVYFTSKALQPCQRKYVAFELKH